jgi:hypothetical protein
MGAEAEVVRRARVAVGMLIATCRDSVFLALVFCFYILFSLFCFTELCCAFACWISWVPTTPTSKGSAKYEVDWPA